MRRCSPAFQFQSRQAEALDHATFTACHRDDDTGVVHALVAIRVPEGFATVEQGDGHTRAQRHTLIPFDFLTLDQLQARLVATGLPVLRGAHPDTLQPIPDLPPLPILDEQCVPDADAVALHLQPYSCRIVVHGDKLVIVVQGLPLLALLPPIALQYLPPTMRGPQMLQVGNQPPQVVLPQEAVPALKPEL